MNTDLILKIFKLIFFCAIVHFFFLTFSCALKLLHLASINLHILIVNSLNKVFYKTQRNLAVLIKTAKFYYIQKKLRLKTELLNQIQRLFFAIYVINSITNCADFFSIIVRNFHIKLIF